TILVNLPVFTSFTEPKGTPGQILTINGTSMLLIKELVFPGNIYATAFGAKTDTKVEVYVPKGTTTGNGVIRLITYEGEEGLLPQIFIGGTDPVVNPALMINGFDESGHDLGWDNWGGNVELGNDPLKGISGKYLHGTKSSCAGWTWIWGCNHSQLPKVSVTKADHLLKMDINITKAFTGAFNFQIQMAGNTIDLGHLGISDGAGNYSTLGWITITFDLSTFSSLPATIPGSGDWGMILSSGTIDITGLYIDNIRFEHK
ncbi:MAG: cell shape determination protein CcmA, partial [Bacteroidetes bacterium]|nr:cell shape determination protein CcmA [Bacteroidota bacterium]